MMPMQAGDVKQTWANTSELIHDYNYTPKTSINKGVSSFINWYKTYYKL